MCSDILMLIALWYLLKYYSHKKGFDEGYNEGFMDGIIEEHNKNDYESIENFVDPA